ncbi:unnamed protein product [Toxocara canis]|uniref:ShKT domain-containing protein n=1 Tax=Toxocara canis TaxID=6265 RepID=A0A183TYB6_TOXCA|nr:unnamed protein product [Toxocara canis]
MSPHIALIAIIIAAVSANAPCTTDNDCKNSPDGKICVPGMNLCGLCIPQLTCPLPKTCSTDGFCVDASSGMTSPSLSTTTPTTTTPTTTTVKTTPAIITTTELLSTTTSTTSGQCVDVASNCNDLSHLCNNAIYSELLSKQCAKTCKQCSGSTSMLLFIISGINILRKRIFFF